MIKMIILIYFLSLIVFFIQFCHLTRILYSLKLPRNLLLCIIVAWGQCALAAPSPKMEKVTPLGKEAMQFTLANVCEESRGCQQAVIAQGWITEESAKKFNERASTLPSGATIILNSDGGDLQSGIELGKAIRAKYLNSRIGTIKANDGKGNGSFTIQAGHCLSACALVFLGGVNRTLEPADIIGFHGLTVTGAKSEVGKPAGETHAKEILGVLGRYIESMGADRRTSDFMLLAKGDAFQRIPLATAKQLSIDNQTSTVLSAWRLQATDNGSLLALVNEKQRTGQAIVALALTKPSPQNGSALENLRLIVYIKPFQRSFNASDIKRSFSDAVTVQLRSRGKVLSGKTLSPWQANGEGVQTTLLISTASIETLTQALSFDIEINIPENSGLNLDRSTPFGTQGLKGVLVTLTK